MAGKRPKIGQYDALKPSWLRNYSRRLSRRRNQFNLESENRSGVFSQSESSLNGREKAGNVAPAGYFPRPFSASPRIAFACPGFLGFQGDQGASLRCPPNKKGGDLSPWRVPRLF
jgi:hypothetical protein